MKTIISTRIDDEELSILKQGAQIDRRSLSGFLRKSSLEKAEEIIKEGEIIDRQTRKNEK